MDTLPASSLQVLQVSKAANELTCTCSAAITSSDAASVVPNAQNPTVDTRVLDLHTVIPSLVKTAFYFRFGSVHHAYN